MKCTFCGAKISGKVNYWQQSVLTPTDNQNQRCDIKFPVSWGGLMAFCSKNCNQWYLEKYSNVRASLKGAPNNTDVISVIKEPYKYNNDKTKQDLDKEGFKRLENDKDKGDGRQQVGLSDVPNLSPQDKSQQVIYQRLQILKTKQNNMSKSSETNARSLSFCDHCSKIIKDNDGIKATLDDLSNTKEKKTKDFLICNEKCLGELIIKRSQKGKKVKKNAKGEIEINLFD